MHDVYKGYIAYFNYSHNNNILFDEHPVVNNKYDNRPCFHI